MATQRYKWVGLAHHCHVPSACVCCVLVHTFHLPVCAPIWIFNVTLISIPTICIALFASFSYKHTITIIPCLTNGVNQAWHHPLLCSWHPLLAVWQVFCRLKPNIRPSWSDAPEQDRREAMLSGSGFGAMKIYRKWQIVFFMLGRFMSIMWLGESELSLLSMFTRTKNRSIGGWFTIKTTLGQQYV